MKRILPVAPALAAVFLLGCDSGEESFVTSKAPSATVAVDLDSFTVRADQSAVRSGPIKFVTRNVHPTDIHELAVLRVRDDGTKQNAGEVEDLKGATSGEILLDLPAGRYELACLIAKGEAGSTVDHYAEGMHVPFEVR